MEQILIFLRVAGHGVPIRAQIGTWPRKAAEHKLEQGERKLEPSASWNIALIPLEMCSRESMHPTSTLLVLLLS